VRETRIGGALSTCFSIFSNRKRKNYQRQRNLLSISTLHAPANGCVNAREGDNTMRVQAVLMFAATVVFGQRPADERVFHTVHASTKQDVQEIAVANANYR
jgi:hypothetical protein